MKGIFNNQVHNNCDTNIIIKRVLKKQRTISIKKRTSRFMKDVEALRDKTTDSLLPQGGKYKSSIRSYTQLLTEAWSQY